MDIFKTLAELDAERKQVEREILIVERVAAATRGKRLGRPPKWMSRVKCLVATAPKKKRAVSAARRGSATIQEKHLAVERAPAGQTRPKA